MLDDDRTQHRMGDVGGPFHINSVRRDHHDNIHEEDGGDVVRLEHDADGMREGCWEVAEVDEEEGAWLEVVDDELLDDDLVEDEDHGDAAHLDDDEVVREDVIHEQRGVVEEQVEEEQEDVQVEALVMGQHYAYVGDDVDENLDELQVVDLSEVEMLTLVLDAEAAP